MDYTQPNLRNINTFSIIGPIVDSARLLSYRQLSIVSPLMDSVRLLSYRQLSILSPIHAYVRAETAQSVSVSTQTPESIAVRSYRRYVLRSKLTDISHLVAPSIHYAATWVPDSVQLKEPIVTEACVLPTDMVHTASIRRYVLRSGILNSAHMESTALTSVAVAEPDSVALKQPALDTVHRMDAVPVVRSLRRYNLYSSYARTIDMETSTLTEVSTAIPDQVAIKTDTLTGLQVMQPDSVKQTSITRYVLVGLISDLSLTKAVSVTEIYTQDTPKAIRPRFCYIA